MTTGVILTLLAGCVAGIGEPTEALAEIAGLCQPMPMANSLEDVPRHIRGGFFAGVDWGAGLDHGR